MAMEMSNTAAHQGTQEPPQGLGAIPGQDATPREAADRELAQLYARQLLECARVQDVGDPGAWVLPSLPPGSAFAQWQAHLHALLYSEPFKVWADEQQVDLSKTIRLDSQSGHIAFNVNGTDKLFGDPASDVPLPAIWPLLASTAQAFGAGSFVLPADPRAKGASLAAVGHFYQVPVMATKTELEQQAALVSHRGFTPSATLQAARSEEAFAEAQRTFGDLLNLHMLSVQLAALAQNASPLPDSLKSTLFTLAAHSSALSREPLAPGMSSSLQRFIERSGFLQPQNAAQLINLASYLKRPPPSSPEHGNFGGALAWPIPPNETQRREWIERLQQSAHYTPGNGVLDYLATHVTPGAPATLHATRSWLGRMLRSAEAKTLGETFQGISLLSPDTDLLLAAISADLDRQTDVDGKPGRNIVAGFDLAQSAHWCAHPSSVVDNLLEHLIGKRSMTRDKAPIAVCLLLSHRAPAFLVKEIPQHVTCGSHTWATFSTAVARIEALAPGASAAMVFSQVMAWADLAPVTAQQAAVEQAAQRVALKDWGVAQGLLAHNAQDNYTDDQLESLREAFNRQLDELKAASTALQIGMPQRRKMALAELQKVFGEQIPFDDKCITDAGAHRDYRGPYSVLDLYMAGKLDRPKGIITARQAGLGALGTASQHTRLSLNYWVSSKAGVNISRILASRAQLPDVDRLFRLAFYAYKPTLRKNLPVIGKHLISRLPLDARRRLEFGKLQLFKVSKATKQPSLHISSSPIYHYALEPHRLLLKTTLAGVAQMFEYDVKQQSIVRRPEMDNAQRGLLNEYSKDTLYLQPFHPQGAFAPPITQATPDTGLVPSSYFSARTAYIAAAMVQERALNTMQAQAKGLTTFDTEFNAAKFLHNTIMSLIPLRSAIANFQEGNVGAGLVDLFLDIFGLVMAISSAGASLGARATINHGPKVIRLLNSAKRVALVTINVLNPLGGVDDLGRLIIWGSKQAWFCAGKLAGKVADISGLTGQARRLGALEKYDLLAASKRFDAAATGNFKVIDELFEGTAVFHAGKWFAYNPVTRAPYGKPLAVFNPKSLAMGGAVKEVRALGEGFLMFEDTHRGCRRLSLDAHGVIAPGHEAASMKINGELMSPNEMLDYLKACGVKIDHYDEIRLTVCDSATGGEQSFAARLARQIKKPVKGYEGSMYVDPNLESIHLDNFVNRAARRDYLERTFLDTPRKVQNKYVEIGRLDDGVMKYHPDPRYKPVNFSPEGVALPRKKRASRPMTEGEIEQHELRLAAANKQHDELNNNITDFSEYDDFNR